MLEASDSILTQIEDQNRHNLTGQLGFFDSPEDAAYEEPALPQVAEYPFGELLAMEKETTGLYLSGHPLTPYKDLYKAVRAARIDQILSSMEEETGDYKDGEPVTLLGMIGNVREKRRKATRGWRI